MSILEEIKDNKHKQIENRILNIIHKYNEARKFRHHKINHVSFTYENDTRNGSIGHESSHTLIAY